MAHGKAKGWGSRGHEGQGRPSPGCGYWRGRGWSNQMLRLDEYGGGDEAEYNSWVILEKAAPVREEAGSS